MKLHTTATTLALLGLFFALPASAYNDRTYPGNLCHADNPSSKPYISQEAGGTFNRQPSSTGSQAVSCPIIRDQTGDTDGLGRLIIHLQTDAAVNSRIDCVLNSRRPNGNYESWSRAYGSFPDFNQGQRHGRGTLELSVGYSFAGGYFEFQCFLPRNAGIIGYHVDE